MTTIIGARNVMRPVADQTDASPAAALAHVATISFLASRAAPTGGFWLALAGGVALARAAERRGIRQGFGASIAATIEAVAIMGPARFGVPLTQAVTAPLLGRLEARGSRLAAQLLVCAAIRLVHNTATTAFFIWVVVGGLDAYAGTYDVFTDRVPLLPGGDTGALLLTGAGLLGWAAFATTVQVLVYRRGLRRWPGGEGEPPATGNGNRPDSPARRFDPRAAAIAAGVAFCLLLASTDWPLLAAVTAWLVAASLAARGDRDVVPTGAALALLLAAGAFTFGIVGGVGLDTALRRALRAALLVAVATWLRAAAGSAGLREVASRSLERLRRLPSVSEAAAVLATLAPEQRLVAAGRSLAASLGPVRWHPLPVLDAVLGWVARESASFSPLAPPARSRLALRARDAVLVVLAAAPLGVLIAV
jgi:hypothetical protein